MYSEFFWKSVTWVALCYKRVCVDKNCIYYTVFITHTNPDDWRVASIIHRTRPFFSEGDSAVTRTRTVEDTRELMYISHPFYSCFNSLSGPFRNYACRSCLLKLVLINCILWKVPRAHRKCIIRFLPFWLLWNPSDYMLLMPWRGHWFLQANICFSCTKHEKKKKP